MKHKHHTNNNFKLSKITTILKKGTRYVLKNAFLALLRQICKVGSGRICPICGFSGGRFAPAGSPLRREAACPKCGARERQRLIWLYFRDEIEIQKKEATILYFSPTTPELVTKFKQIGDVITVDLLMSNVDIHVDIMNLPFKDDTFDIVICSHVLEHIPDDNAALSELFRILNKGGNAFIMVPKDKDREKTYESKNITTPKRRREEFGQKDHVRLYGNDILDRLSNAGFEVSIQTYAQNMDKEDIKKYGLNQQEGWFKGSKYEDIHICKK